MCSAQKELHRGIVSSRGPVKDQALLPNVLSKWPYNICYRLLPLCPLAQATYRLVTTKFNMLKTVHRPLFQQAMQPF